jgi:magnesium transporter
MDGLLTRDGQTAAATKADVQAAITAGTFFWLDLDAGATGHDGTGAPGSGGPGPAPAVGPPKAAGSAAPPPIDGSTTDVLLNLFRFHPLTVEDAEDFGQRPKLEDYDDYVYLVAHGAAPDGNGTIEVHIFCSAKYVVTVHRGDCPHLDQVRERLGHHHSTGSAPPQIVLVYLLVDTLTDSFFPVLSAFDDRIDTLESAILKQPTEDQLGLLFNMKRSLMTIRKVITPQRDMFAALSSGVTDIPGMTDESTRYFRDLYDHLIRISDLVDSYRDLLSGVMDTHLSTVSNRLNVVMKQLAIIATIFLPLSFLTGFFGQNWGLLYHHFYTDWWNFWALGIGSEIVAVVFLVILFQRRGWLGGPTA